jgi:hypothetical protein
MNVMEVVRCSRCGAFYTNGGYVCAKGANKFLLKLVFWKKI